MKTILSAALFTSLLFSFFSASCMEYPFGGQQKKGCEVIDLTQSPEAKTPPKKKQKTASPDGFKTPPSMQNTIQKHGSLQPRTLFDSPQKAITLLHSSQSRDCGVDVVKNSLNKLKNGDSIIFHQFRLRKIDEINLLRKKAKEGVDVQIIIGPDDKPSIDNARNCTKDGISAYVYNYDKKTANGPFAKIFHCKTAIWKFLKDGKEQYRTWSGSRNSTNQAAENNEVMVYDKSPETFNQALGAHNWIKKFCFQLTANGEIPPVVKGKLPVGDRIIATPQKNLRITSLTDNICGTITKRIQNANNELSAVLYTIDNKEAQDAFLDRAKDGKLKVFIIDGQATKKNDTNIFLAKLAQHGVNVRVFNPDGSQKFHSYPLINHAKLILRTQQNGKTLLATGSANLTDHNNNDINHFSFYDCDEQLKKETEALIADSIQISVPFVQTTVGKSLISKKINQ